jgi:hypothetical protein
VFREPSLHSDYSREGEDISSPTSHRNSSFKSRFCDHFLEGEELTLRTQQCSTVFFDRTKLVDERPDVFDIFANAIGHVVSLINKNFVVTGN